VTSFPQWLVLTVLAGNGGASDRGHAVRVITSARKLEAEVVLAAVHELNAAGLVTETDDRVTMTDAGRATHGQIRARITEVTGRLFDGFAREELETAGRVLAIVTERANAELARLAL